MRSSPEHVPGDEESRGAGGARPQDSGQIDQIGDSGVSADDTREKLEQISEKLSEAYLRIPQPETQDAKADPQLGIQTISFSTRTFKSALEAVTLLNEIGRISDDRSRELQADLVVVATSDVLERQKSKGRSGQVREGEARLARLLVEYGKKQNESITLPKWFVGMRSVFSLVGEQNKLPGPEVYVEASPALAEECATEVARIREIEELINKIRNSGGDSAGADGRGPVDELRDEKDKIRDRLDKRLREVADVDPRSLSSVGQNVSIQAVMNADIMRACLDFRKGLGELIQKVVSSKGGGELSEDQGAEKKRLECPFLLYDKQDKGTLKVSYRTLEVEEFLGLHQDQEILPVLLQYYREIHTAIVQGFRILENACPSDPHSPLVTLKREIPRMVDAVFPFERSRSRELVFSLCEMTSESIAQELGGILSLPIIIDTGRGHTEIKSSLAQKENIGLLRFAVRDLIAADSDRVALLRQSFHGSALTPVLESSATLRKHLDAKDIRAMSIFIDDTLKRLTDSSRHSTFEEKAGFLYGLLQVSEEVPIRRALKGRLKNLALVDKVAASLNDGSLGAATEQARTVEGLRAMVSRRFSSDLSDYWGNQELVKRLSEMIRDHIRLLKNPQAWEGSPPDEVFYNGHLLFGDPGAGKGFLVKCLSNEFALPLVTITREEMSEALREKPRSALDRKDDAPDLTDQKEIEATLSKLLKMKIEEASTKMRQSGAAAAIIFIDEVEVEFLKRNPEFSERDELTRTNVMLRVIEREIESNPDKIFFSATNHIELVDEAARRLGRYGLHHEVRMPNKVDVSDILSGVFGRWGLSLEETIAKSTEYTELVNACVGMSPKAIKVSLGNKIALARIDSPNMAKTLTPELLRRLREGVELTLSLRHEDERASGQGTESVPANG